ncbi:26 proteasome complex subunit DSS1 [Candida albicans P34048]|nr:26 proteasome complex subunit DSS1 [Candida albicans P34048]KGU29215.1 26 proteasome complex subunit DSS1 [Candida albicans P57055]
MSDATKLDSKPSITIPSKHTSGLTEEEKNVIKTLEEDDEFEDFPEDDSKWSSNNTNKLSEQNLWEEDWDDDDGQDEVSNKLREELKKTIKPIQ